MISRPIRALVWECWRLSRQEILISVFSLLLFVLLFMSLDATMDRDAREIAGFMFSTILATVSTISFAWTQGFNSQQPFSFSRHFTKPISTRLLVFIPLLTIMVKTFCTSLLLLSFFGWFSSSNFAPLSASMGVSTVTGLLVAVSWSTDSLKWRAAIFLAIIGFAFLLLTSYAAEGAEGQFLNWPTMKWSFYLLAGIGITSAIPLTVSSVARQRNELGTQFAGKRQCQETYPDAGSMRLGCQFSNPFTAMVWFELKRLGKKILFWAIVLHFLFGVFTGFSSLLAGPISNLNFFVSYCFTSISLTLLLAGFFGSIAVTGTLPMPMPLTARPVSDEQFAFSRLAVLLIQFAICSAVSALFIVAFLIMQSTIGGGLNLTDIGNFPKWLQPSISSLSLQLILLALHLFVLGGISVAVIGLSWFSLAHFCIWRVASFTMFPFLILAGVGWDAEHEKRFEILWPWMGLTYVSILAASIAWLAWKSIWSKRIGRPMIALILAVWLLEITLAALFANIAYPEWRQRIEFINLLSIAIASWTPAGLAIALPGIFFRLRHQA